MPRECAGENAQNKVEREVEGEVERDLRVGLAFPAAACGKKRARRSRSTGHAPPALHLSCARVRSALLLVATWLLSAGRFSEGRDHPVSVIGDLPPRTASTPTRMTRLYPRI